MNTNLNEKAARLLDLIKERPELPIVPMVDAEIIGDEFGIYMGAFGAARVDSYIIDQYGMVLFKSSDDVIETLERCLSEAEFDALPEPESECRTVFEALPWKEAIVAEIVTLD